MLALVEEEEDILDSLLSVGCIQVSLPNLCKLALEVEVADIQG